MGVAIAKHGYSECVTANELILRLRRPWPGDEFDENGVNISIIRSNLTLTPTERVRLGDQLRIAELKERDDALWQSELNS
jgi:hypothetical protein